MSADPGQEIAFPKPGELWSLWGLMKKLSAYDIAGASARLEMATDCYTVSREAADPPDVNVHRSLGPKRLTQVKEALGAAGEVCRQLGMSDLADMFEIAKEDPPRQMETLHFAINQFEAALLKRWVFIPTPDADTFYSQKALFGQQVNDAFPSSAFEVADVGNCIALMQPTAAVFHMMRAMEPPMVALGREFGVIRPLDNWNSFLNDIEKAFRDRDPSATKPADWATEQDYYTDMTTYLFSVKNAWRNYTAHLKTRYTDEEAREILGNVKSFMKRAAKRLRE